MGLKKLIHLKQIDAVLGFLANSKYEKGKFYPAHILTNMHLHNIVRLLDNKKVKKFSENEITTILNKLEKDGYVEYENEVVYFDRPNNSGLSDGVNMKCYYISFEGYMFYEQGGYIRQNRLNRLKIFSYRFHVFIISAAAIVASVYYIRELISKPAQQYVPQNKCKSVKDSLTLDSLKH